MADRVRFAAGGQGPNSTHPDLAPDGKRVAVITPAGTDEASKTEHEIVVWQNFFDELRRKTPVQ